MMDQAKREFDEMRSGLETDRAAKRAKLQEKLAEKKRRLAETQQLELEMSGVQSAPEPATAGAEGPEGRRKRVEAAAEASLADGAKSVALVESAIASNDRKGAQQQVSKVDGSVLEGVKAELAAAKEEAEALHRDNTRLQQHVDSLEAERHRSRSLSLSPSPPTSPPTDRISGPLPTLSADRQAAEAQARAEARRRVDHLPRSQSVERSPERGHEQVNLLPPPRPGFVDSYIYDV